MKFTAEDFADAFTLFHRPEVDEMVAQVRFNSEDLKGSSEAASEVQLDSSEPLDWRDGEGSTYTHAGYLWGALVLTSPDQEIGTIQVISDGGTVKVFNLGIEA